jgi:ATP-dependent DNA helicase RecQ
VKAVGEIVEALGGVGIRAEGYHGRMRGALRHAVQDRFMGGELPVVVATNAFGLGIDKPDIRLVVHAQTPGSLEAYYQEFGRAGRDGGPARGLLLHHPDDRKLQAFFKGRAHPDADDLVNVHHALKRLAAEGSIALGDLHAICPVPRTRTGVVMALLRERGVVREGEERGRYELAEPDLERADLERMARGYAERDAVEQGKLASMMEYAEGSGCRWRSLLEYFGDTGPERCGRCDRCADALPPGRG